MIRYLLISYVVVYAVVTAFVFVAYAGVVPKDDKKGDKPWKTPLDLILALAALAGMLLFFFSIEPHWL